MYYYSRRYDEAIRQFKIALELDPSHRWSHSRLAQVYEQQARYDDAMREFAAGGFTHARARVSARAGQPREARQILESASLSSSPHERALLLAALGEVDAALDALEQATALPRHCSNVSACLTCVRKSFLHLTDDRIDVVLTARGLFRPSTTVPSFTTSTAGPALSVVP